jgi:DNA-binding MarR family transcriptional regulator
VSTPKLEPDAPASAIVRATTELSTGRAAFTQVVAERFGLAATDVECLGLLASEGSMTVGRLGELTALTTGATTRMVDRLEQAGYVRRVPDPADRRRVIVEPVPARTAAVAAAFDPLDAAVRAALSPASRDDVRAIRSFLETAVAGSRDAIALARTSEAAAIAASTAGNPPPSGSTAPVASATSGRLVFVTAAPNVVIATDPALGRDLYRARFSGAVPSARVRDGVITIRYPRFAWFDFRTRIADQWVDASAHWRTNRTELVLNDRLPWMIEFRGGATAIDADLRAVRVGGVGIAGGAGVVQLRLGVPSGLVRVRLTGGAKDVTVLRPLGVATTLRVAGGYRKATLDGVAAGSGGRIETPGAAAIPDRYEIELTGGTDRVTVMTARPEG